MSNTTVFKDRDEASKRLVTRLRQMPWPPRRTVIMGLTMHGIPVAAAVARELHHHLDIVLVETLRNTDGAVVGAVTANSLYMDARVLLSGELTRGQFDVLRLRAMRTLRHRQNLFSPLRPELDLSGMTVVLVDDALETGATMRAAVEATRIHNPEKVIVAAPVTTDIARRRLAPIVDGFFAAERYQGPGAPTFYAEPGGTTDDDVARILGEAAARRLTAA